MKRDFVWYACVDSHRKQHLGSEKLVGAFQNPNILKNVL